MTTEQLTPRGLERRLKRHFLRKEHAFLATTTPGFEHFLKQEVIKLENANKINIVRGGVEFCGPLELIYLSNLLLRTSNRILLRIGSFKVRSYPELYDKLKRVSWELYIGLSEKFSIESTSRRSRIHHTENLSATACESITGCMKRLGRMPVRDESALLKFKIRLFEDVCTVSIDTSGDYLYKRGYRQHTLTAPLRETSASALLIAAGISNCNTLFDPMCGSGVIPIEAALISRCMAPGRSREFAFFGMPFFDGGKWDRILNSAREQEKKSAGITIVASDSNPEVNDSVRANASKAGVERDIEIRCADFFQTNGLQSAGKGKGLIISNLPYGKRVKTNDMSEFLQNFSTYVKTHFSGWHFGFISASPEFESVTGFSVSKRIRFENGGIPVCFYIGRV